MDNEFCPYCGSSNTHRTAFGYGESIVKNTATYAIGLSVAMAAHFIPHIGKYAGHGVIHITEKVSKYNSCEYQCENCHRKFRYSSADGSQKR